MGATRDWSTRVPDNVAFRRAGGRRYVNAYRQFLAALRRSEILAILQRTGMDLRARGTRAELARRLGVSRTTIGRDIDRIFCDAAEHARCPACGRLG